MYDFLEKNTQLYKLEILFIYFFKLNKKKVKRVHFNREKCLGIIHLKVQKKKKKHPQHSLHQLKTEKYNNPNLPPLKLPDFKLICCGVTRYEP